MTEKKINISPNCGGFMSRFEMLQWVNDMIQGHFARIEDLCSGVAYCRLMSIIFPNSINLKRVKMLPSLQYEYVHNLRLLQDAFNALSLDQPVPIDLLVQGRFKHNLEFLQWFKKFFDSQLPQLECKLLLAKKPAGRLSRSSSKPIEQDGPKSEEKKPPRGQNKQQSLVKGASPSKTKPGGVATKKKKDPNPKPKTIPEAEQTDKKTIQQPTGEMTQLIRKTTSLTKERDAAYRKLIGIEKIIISWMAYGVDSHLCDGIRAILAAPKEEAENRSPTKNGDPNGGGKN